MTPAQCRKGRLLAKLTERGLAKRAGLMITAVKRYESGEILPPISQRMLRAALEGVGVEFIGGLDDKAAVRLKPPVAAQQPAGRC